MVNNMADEISKEQRAEWAAILVAREACQSNQPPPGVVAAAREYIALHSGWPPFSDAERKLFWRVQDLAYCWDAAQRVLNLPDDEEPDPLETHVENAMRRHFPGGGSIRERARRVVDALGEDT